jgi:hypothetical protein
MLKRGVPLQLAQLDERAQRARSQDAAPGNATIGRFFPQSCNVIVDDRAQTMTVSTSGTGYVGLPVARRVGFSVAMAVTYRPDFRMESEGTWVWGTFVGFAQQPDLRIVGVENAMVSLATMTPAGSVANAIGTSIVTGEIGKGFTVVRSDDGDDFALGHLEPPQKPKRQFEPGKDHVVLATSFTEVRAAERDYIGPLEVTQSNAALFFHAKVSGNAVAYAVVDRSVGEPWRRSYEQAQPLAPPPGPMLAQGILALGDAELRVPVNPGVYYVVVENQATAPIVPLVPETIAYVSYSAELGDR